VGRTVLVALLLMSGSLGLATYSMKGQAPTPNPAQEPRGGQQEPIGPGAEGPPLPNAEKRILEDNDKDMKKKVERLYQLASELKEQVDKTDSTKVLSLNLMKKAEEIEKLARDIKNRSKG
jgi:hypothetical protein